MKIKESKNEETITSQKNSRASNVKVLTPGSCKVETAVDGGGEGAAESYAIGSEICFDSNECFIVYKDKGSTLSLLAKKNIRPDLNNPIQDSNADVVKFSSSPYWSGSSNSFIYSSQSEIYKYVEAYETYLKGLGVTSANASVLALTDLSDIGCYKDSPYNDDLNCNGTGYESWIKSPNRYYWLGTNYSGDQAFIVDGNSRAYPNTYWSAGSTCVRPTVQVSKTDIP